MQVVVAISVFGLNERTWLRNRTKARSRRKKNVKNEKKRNELHTIEKQEEICMVFI